jgi:hypothetical protein
MIDDVAEREKGWVMLAPAFLASSGEGGIRLKSTCCL